MKNCKLEFVYDQKRGSAELEADEQLYIEDMFSELAYTLDTARVVKQAIQEGKPFSITFVGRPHA